MENAITDINIVERKLLANIKRRPGMYIGKMSLEFLQNFFNGYNCAAKLHFNDKKHHILPEGFNDFVAVKLLGHNKTVLNYCSLIYETEGDEDKAVNMFFELLNAIFPRAYFPARATASLMATTPQIRCSMTCSRFWTAIGQTSSRQLWRL